MAWGARNLGRSAFRVPLKIQARAFGNPLLWLAIIFIVMPYIMPGSNPFTLHKGFVDLGTTILIFAIFAIGFNLLFGHTGELSFGHAMFFTIGAYATALYTKGYHVNVFGLALNHGASNNLVIALLLSLGAAAVWAVLLARLIVPRSSGIYFSMVTLAFAQVIYFITFNWSELTGGEDGLQGIARPILDFLPDNAFKDSTFFFYFTALVAFIMFAAMHWILRSPFGSVLHALRENRQRAQFLGYDVTKYRINAFFLSALWPAVAGWLWAYYQQSINPDAGSVEYSGRIVMMSLLGGINTFVGPALGALVYWELQNNLSQLTKYWEGYVGAVFAVFVLVAPRGIWGAIEDIQHYGLQNALRRVFSREARVMGDIAEELPPVAVADDSGITNEVGR